MIKLFKDLLKMTAEQEQPQRLLFLFAKADAQNPKKSKKHQRGTITPVMCVDKLPEELSSFKVLVEEADSIEKSWNFVFIASLSGQNGTPPTTDEAEPYLNKMTHDIESGHEIGRYVIFDRQENAIEIEAND